MKRVSKNEYTALDILGLLHAIKFTHTYMAFGSFPLYKMIVALYIKNLLCIPKKSSRSRLYFYMYFASER